jgi:hypothetical protein
MSLFDEDGLRTIIAQEVGKAIERILGDPPRLPTQSDQYLPVTDAARIAAVAPATIRTWMDEGRLTRYHAGRVLRVRRSELEALMRTGSTKPDGLPLSPEAEADRFLQRRQQRAQAARRG